ncbi:MAG: GNAT family N-acetyltransferase [Planctomycetota bacterium]
MHRTHDWSADLRHAARLVPLPGGVRIRRFEPSDAARVHALLVAVGSETSEPGPWLARQHARKDHDPHLWLLADTDAGELVGVAFGARAAGSATARIDVVAVAAPWRRRGAGSALCGRLLELLRRRRVQRATIAAPHAMANRNWLASQGFEPTTPGADTIAQPDALD